MLAGASATTRFGATVFSNMGQPETIKALKHRDIIDDSAYNPADADESAFK